MNVLLKRNPWDSKSFENMVEHFFKKEIDRSLPLRSNNNTISKWFSSIACYKRVEEDLTTFEFLIPGIEKDNIKVEVKPEQSILTLTIKNKSKNEEGFENYDLVKSFQLPKNTQSIPVEKELKNGILTLKFRQQIPEELKPVHIEL